MDINQESIRLHEIKKGKIEVNSKVPLKNKHDLSLAYTPGVAQVCRDIHKDKSKVFDLTIKQNTVAVVTDGSAVLGLGNIGPEAALPVMEGKAVLFKEFGRIDAFPICLSTQDTKEIIETVKRIAPVFGGINLEDISAPRCFEIEDLLQDLGIPVFHDDQHGTAVVVLAGLMNACKVVGKRLNELKVVMSGAGAAGIAIAKILSNKVNDIILCDSKGAISKERKDLNSIKKDMLKITNKDNVKGTLMDAVKEADVFIGVSVAGIMTKDMVKSMNKDSIIFALANPDPEIMPDDAKEAGAMIIATGRSDFPNQVNNVLAFPGIFRGALDAKAISINEEMKAAAAKALANHVKIPNKELILPNPLDKEVGKIIGKAVKKTAIETGVVRD
jgi:malate dehydrogenase (oxaloacetate-decarboxylating)